MRRGLNAAAAGRVTHWFALLALLLGAAPPLCGAQDLVFRHLSVEDGLSRTWVRALFKDSRGFLWIGTEGGLDRFDGQRIVSYKPKRGDPSSLAASRVSALLEDGEGRLWVGTQAGLQRYDRERDHFVSVTLPEATGPESVLGLAKGADGRIWVGTARGLVVLDADPGRSRRLLPRPDDPQTLSNANVPSVLVDREGGVWAATGAGVNRVDAASGRVTRIPYDTDEPTATGGRDATHLYQDPSGVVWVSSQNGGGLSAIEPKTGRVTRYLPDPATPGTIGTARIRCTVADGQGRLYVGTENGGLEVLDLATRRFQRYLPRRGDDLSIGGCLDLRTAPRRPGHPLDRDLQCRDQLHVRGPAPLRARAGAPRGRAQRSARRGSADGPPGRALGRHGRRRPQPLRARLAQDDRVPSRSARRHVDRLRCHPDAARGPEGPDLARRLGRGARHHRPGDGARHDVPAPEGLALRQHLQAASRRTAPPARGFLRRARALRHRDEDLCARRRDRRRDPFAPVRAGSGRGRGRLARRERRCLSHRPPHEPDRRATLRPRRPPVVRSGFGPGIPPRQPRQLLGRLRRRRAALPAEGWRHRARLDHRRRARRQRRQGHPRGRAREPLGQHRSRALAARGRGVAGGAASLHQLRGGRRPAGRRVQVRRRVQERGGRAVLRRAEGLQSLLRLRRSGSTRSRPTCC